MAGSSDDAGMASDRMPGTPIGQLFKHLHTPPAKHDEDERKKMKLSEATGFLAPSRLVFEELPSTHSAQSTSATAKAATPRNATTNASGDPHASLRSQIGGLLKEQIAPANQSVESLRGDLEK